MLSLSFFTFHIFLQFFFSILSLDVQDIYLPNGIKNISLYLFLLEQMTNAGAKLSDFPFFKKNKIYPFFWVHIMFVFLLSFLVN